MAVPRQHFFCGSFLLIMFHFSIYYAVLSVSCGLVVACWEGLASCVCVCVFFFVVLPFSVPCWCGAWLYHFLIFAFFSLNKKHFV